MVNVTIKRNFNLNNIKLDFHKELNNSLDVIALDIEKGIDNQHQFGKPIPRNEDDYLEQKRKRGWGEKSLIAEKKWLRDSGKMVRTKATREHQIAILAPYEQRTDIAKYLQIDGVETRHGNKKYIFWGVSEKAEKHIMKMMKYKLIKELKSA